MLPNALTSMLVLGVMAMQLPPIIPWSDDILSLPTTTLPWPVPDMPIIQIDLEDGTATFDEVSHGAGYAANAAEFTDQLVDVTGIQVDADAELEDWLGAAAVIPDVSGGADFDAGIDLPGYDDQSAYDVATELGTNVGTLFENIRALATINLDIGGMDYAIKFVVLCIAWMVLVMMIKFAIQVVDMIFSLVAKIIELIPVVE